MDHSMTAGFAPGPGTPVWSPSLTPSSESEYIGALLGLFVLSVAFRGLVAAQGYLEAYLHLHSYPRPPSRSQPKPSPFTSSPPSHTNEQQQPDPSSPSPPLGPAGSTEQAANHQQHCNVEPESTVLEFTDEKHILPSDNTTPPLSLAHDHQGSRLQVPPAGQGAQQRRRYAIMPPHQADSPACHQQPLIHHHNNTKNDSSEAPTSWLFPLPTAQPFVWQAEISRALLSTLVVAVGYMLMLVVMTYNSAYLAVILVGVFVGEVYFARWGRVRPVFPAPLRRRRHEGGDLSPQDPIPQHQQQQQQQQQQQSALTTIPSAFSSNIDHDSISRQQQHQGEPLTRTSASSVRSSTSSRGYSSTMMNHGLSADGAC
ncbi:hypothetical protein KVV02_001936 [Mortierella alpina]|uniref:Copper transport protein n=1 Tax=Mortierella alpina TaxID=64518 RepID=A0A9P8CV48_MORAP|nr:hypothetical protein KVV02_001936 [Mortierella alpina]